jgi:hypothetical protein
MLIVKVFPDAGEGRARESAALATAPAGAPVPRLVAAGASPVVVVVVVMMMMMTTTTTDGRDRAERRRCAPR